MNGDYLAHPDIVHELVKRQVGWWALQVEVSDIKFAVWIAPPREHAVIEVIPFQQVFANLFMNAIVSVLYYLVVESVACWKLYVEE